MFEFVVMFVVSLEAAGRMLMLTLAVVDIQSASVVCQGTMGDGCKDRVWQVVAD